MGFRVKDSWVSGFRCQGFHGRIGKAIPFERFTLNPETPQTLDPKPIAFFYTKVYNPHRVASEDLQARGGGVQRYNTRALGVRPLGLRIEGLGFRARFLGFGALRSSSKSEQAIPGCRTRARGPVYPKPFESLGCKRCCGGRGSVRPAVS